MAKQSTIVFVIGARPELIKLAPVIEAVRNRSRLRTRIIFSGQHRELVHQVAADLGISPDRDLGVMRSEQTLPELTSRLLVAMDEALEVEAPNLVVAQGDTTSVVAAALAAFYRRLPFAHVEAGLRSGDKYAPFPEDANRRIVSQLADLHFAPTEAARENLLREGVAAGRVHLTGNTIVDAVTAMLRRAPANEAMLPIGRPVLLVTIHRRENLGKVLEQLARAVKQIALMRPDIEIVWPVHPRPEIRAQAEAVLSGVVNVHLTGPMNYAQFIHTMSRSLLIMTDSGGVQEEAPSAGVPVVVLRDVTERPEGLAAGVAVLVGTSSERIVAEVTRLLEDAEARGRMTSGTNPYGDGLASHRIADLIERWVTTDHAND